MARIAGIDLPRNKKIEFALTYIHGIGLSSSKKICELAGITDEKRVNNLSEAELTKIRDIIDKDLESGKHKKIITRFPPEPNGYLHIGHAKSICLNFGIALKYDGMCNLRFDDTNPEKENVEYVNSIVKDVRWLGFEFDEPLYGSDYFDMMYDYAVQLIKLGKAYVDDQDAKIIKEFRGTLTEHGTNSPFRDRTIEENLILFQNMKDGKYKDGEKVLRAKIDMYSPNMNMRDPVLYRICLLYTSDAADE